MRKTENPENFLALDMEPKKKELKQKLKDGIDKKIASQCCKKFEEKFDQFRLDTNKNVEKYLKDLENNRASNVTAWLKLAGGVVVNGIATAFFGLPVAPGLVINPAAKLVGKEIGANENSLVKKDLSSLSKKELSLEKCNSRQIVISTSFGTIKYPLTTE